jgi:DNA-binding NarL/FixJ family response regulator
MSNPADTPAAPITRVLIADSQRLLLKSLEAVIGASSGMAVCASATSGFATLEAIQEHHPTVAVLDMSFSDLDGMALLDAIERDGSVETRCVFLTRPDDAELACDAVGAGVAGWVDRAAGPDELRAAIWAAATDSAFFTAGSHTAIHQEMNRRATSDPSDIDEAIREVLQLSADDLTPNQIATLLHLAPATVRGRLQTVRGARYHRGGRAGHAGGAHPLRGSQMGESRHATAPATSHGGATFVDHAEDSRTLPSRSPPRQRGVRDPSRRRGRRRHRRPCRGEPGAGPDGGDGRRAS